VFCTEAMFPTGDFKSEYPKRAECTLNFLIDLGNHHLQYLEHASAVSVKLSPCK
jgi:hypothetical protein